MTSRYPTVQTNAFVAANHLVCNASTPRVSRTREDWSVYLCRFALWGYGHYIVFIDIIDPAKNKVVRSA